MLKKSEGNEITYVPSFDECCNRKFILQNGFEDFVTRTCTRTKTVLDGG